MIRTPTNGHYPDKWREAITTLNRLKTSHFDVGAVKRLGKELSRLGVTQPLLITDAGVRAAGLLDHVLEAAELSNVSVFDDTPPNPTQTAVEAALKQYREEGCDGVGMCRRWLAH